MVDSDLVSGRNGPSIKDNFPPKDRCFSISENGSMAGSEFVFYWPRNSNRLQNGTATSRSPPFCPSSEENYQISHFPYYSD